MSYMFSNAGSFNQPIGNWNTIKVFDMGSVLTGASSFNQNIGNWDITNVKRFSSSLFDDIGLDSTAFSIAKYDSILIKWSLQNVNKNIYLSTHLYNIVLHLHKGISSLSKLSYSILYFIKGF